MIVINLKNILLMSQSSKSPIYGKKFINYKRKLYGIDYLLQGEYIKILCIRQLMRKSTFTSRVNRRKRFLHSVISYKDSRKNIEHHATQTTKVSFNTSETQVDFMPKMVSRYQQTTMVKSVSETTQTDYSSVSCGVQVEPMMDNASIQSDIFQQSKYTQTRTIYLNHMQMQTDHVITQWKQALSPEEQMIEDIETALTTSAESTGIEAMILLMNEISKIILSQNEILHTNTAQLDQVSQMLILNKTFSQQRALADLKRFNQLKAKRQKIVPKKTKVKNRPIIIYRRRKVETVNQYVQTSGLVSYSQESQTDVKERLLGSNKFFKIFKNNLIN